jgi:hypothetical protein
LKTLSSYDFNALEIECHLILYSLDLIKKIKDNNGTYIGIGEESIIKWTNNKFPEITNLYTFDNFNLEIKDHLILTQRPFVFFSYSVFLTNNLKTVSTLLGNFLSLFKTHKLLCVFSLFIYNSQIDLEGNIYKAKILKSGDKEKILINKIGERAYLIGDRELNNLILKHKLTIEEIIWGNWCKNSTSGNYCDVIVLSKNNA